MGKLTNKVAVVTGSSKGIGAAIAKRFAAEGASVVVNYSTSREGAEKVVKEIESRGGKAIAVGANLSKEDEITHLFEETKKAFGKVDILVNNAGKYSFAALDAIDDGHFRQLYDTNVFALLFATKAALPLFPAEGGSVINVGSVVSSLAPPNSVVYVSSKAAVDAATKVLVKELAPRKIRVNSINPGMIETEGLHAAGVPGSPMEQMVVSITPLGRVGQPDEIAGPAVFLASDDSRYITGDILFVSGGSGI